MDQEIFEWAQLLGRWLHIVTAVSWIGASVFFMWLDRTFTPNPDSTRPGHLGELWMVHGGGFYHVEKMQMGPTRVPEHLHWFKWESYWTWLSGLFLLLTIFYTGHGTFLIDRSVATLDYGSAVGIGIASFVVSWLAYDFLWESALTKKHPLAGHALTLLLFAGVSLLLCRTLSGRAAYIHVGAMLGTWMTANVFLRIIPRQVKMVEAAKVGQPVNQEWAKNAKARSTHNTYFTLPVVFLMLSNHFPMTYGNKSSWLILLAVTAAGAAIRHFFVIRLARPEIAKAFAGLGCALLVAVILGTRENTSAMNAGAGPSASVPEAPLPETAAPSTTTLTSAPSSAPGPAAGDTANVRGVVKFTGTPPVRAPLTLPPGCAPDGGGEILANEVLVKEGRLQNALVRITKGLEGKEIPPAPTKPVVLDQRHCVYHPRVVGARVGQPVEFVNSDAVFHNVRSVTSANADFNVGMPNQGDRITRVFTKPEIALQAKCSVHPWMSGYVAVVDHPYFSVTGEDGVFALHGVPPGTYTLELWHEVYGTQTKAITVGNDGVTALEFEVKP